MSSATGISANVARPSRPCQSHGQVRFADSEGVHRTLEIGEASTTKSSRPAKVFGGRGPARRVRARALWAAVLAGLVLVLYGPVLKLLVLQWWEDPNYCHGFLVPIFAGYILWRNRRKWQGMPSEPSNSGLAILLLALAMLVAGTLGAELFISRVSFLVLIVGLMVYFRGWPTLKAVSFPTGYLIFMIPLPAIIFFQIALPLQLLATRFAETCLDLLQVPALRQGNLLILPNTTLQVAEACSGIRSLITLVALAVAYGYLAEKARWKQITLVCLMVPVAVITNGLRLTATGTLTYLSGQRMAEGVFHLFLGWVVFLIAVGCVLAVHKGLSMIGRTQEAGSC